MKNYELYFEYLCEDSLEDTKVTLRKLKSNKFRKLILVCNMYANLSIHGKKYPSSKANITTLPTAVTGLTRVIKITLSQAETNADNIAIIFVDAAGAEWCDMMINIQTVDTQFNDIGEDISALPMDVVSLE